MNVALPIELTALHVLLAYAGLLIHTLAKLGKAVRVDSEFTFKKFAKNHAINFIGSLLLIPVVLLMACDYVNETMPINNTTSVFVGWNTNSAFRAFMGVRSKKSKEQADLEADE